MMYRKNKFQFLTKKLCHYSEVALASDDYLCYNKSYTLNGANPDLSDWLLYAIGQNADDYTPENIKSDKDGLHCNVWFDGSKMTISAISKKFESYGHFRFLAKMAQGNQGIFSACWLWGGLGYERGGYVEYDFEHDISEQNKIHCANHVGFWYDRKFHKHSQRRNTLYKKSYFPTEDFYWYIFKVYPDRIEKWINNILVNVVFTHGQQSHLYAVFNCETGGITKGNPKNNVLPVQATLKKFQYIPFRRQPCI